MLDAILSFLGPVLGFLANQYGTVGMVIGYVVLVGLPLVSVLIEVADALVKLTVSPADDAVMGTVEAVWAKVMPWLELLPHVNLPLSPVIQAVLKYAGKGVGAVVGAIKGWMGGGSPPPASAA